METSAVFFSLLQSSITVGKTKPKQFKTRYVLQSVSAVYKC